MAETERNNLQVAEAPEFTREIPGIDPNDPVHFAQMNEILEKLLGNDVFLDKMANKMIEKNLIAHVLDCENAQMVLGADQAPMITGLIDGVREDVAQLYSDMAGGVSVRYDAESDYVQVYNGEKWFDWQSVGLIAFNVLTLPTTAWNRNFTNNNYEFTIAGGELRIKNNTYVTGSVSLTLPQGAFGHNTVEVAGTTYLYTTARASIQVGGIRYETPAGGSKYNPFVAEFSVSTIVKGDVLTISLPAYAGEGAYCKTEITLTKLLIK